MEKESFEEEADWVSVEQNIQVEEMISPVTEERPLLEPFPPTSEEKEEHKQEAASVEEEQLPKEEKANPSPPPPPPPSNPMLHIIDEDLTLAPDVQEYMANKWNLIENGMDYNLVAVFGSQSTGKSTLLNLLFQTNFDVMKESSRQQTTKGLWLSKGIPQNTLVMDVEGTDGRERGENQDMERRSAVFSLAISQVLIVNLFEHDVGRYNGANYGLLKIVFEVNLQLFQAAGSPKTLLFFVIRDHAQTPLKNLSETLQKDLRKIWGELSKPSGFEKSQIEDFFDLKFTALPHKVFKPEEFTEAVIKLREWFSDPQNPDYLFLPQYHKQVPADGFSRFVSDIWDKITTNRDLDLPTQKQLLAQFRCDEISSAAFSKIAPQIRELSESVERAQITPQLGEIIKKLRQETFDEYQKLAHRYDKSVNERIGKELLEKINDSFYVIYSGTLTNLAKRAVAQFLGELEASINKGGGQFILLANELRERILDGFTSFAEELTLPQTEWRYQPRLDELTATLEAETQSKRQEQMTKTLSKFKENLQFTLVEPLRILIGEAEKDMWVKIQRLLVSVLVVAKKFLENFAAGYGCSGDEIEQHKGVISLQLFQLLREQLLAATSDSAFYQKLQKRFEITFKFDENRRPRLWKNLEEINFHFDDAKLKANDLLLMFVQPDENLDVTILGPEFQVEKLINEERKRNFWERLEIEANGMYQEAVNSTQNAIGKIPPWLFGALFVLGFNELMTILSNPIYLFLAVLIGGATFAVVSMGMEAPVLQMINAVFNEALRIVWGKGNPPNVPAPRASS